MLPLQFRVAAVAVGDLVVPARFRAGGRFLILPHRGAGGVAQGVGGEVLPLQFRVAAVAVGGLVVPALFGAGGLHFVPDEFLSFHMAQRVDLPGFLMARVVCAHPGFLPGRLACGGGGHFPFTPGMAQRLNRAGFLMACVVCAHPGFLPGRLACGGSGHFPCAPGMAQGVSGDGLAAQFSLAHRAVYYFVIAALFRASGCFFVFLYRFAGLMAQGGNGRMAVAHGFAATGASDHFVIATIFRTGGILFVLTHRAARIMAQGENGLCVFAHFSAAARAMHNRGPAAGIGAVSGLLCHLRGSRHMHMLEQGVKQDTTAALNRIFNFRLTACGFRAFRRALKGPDPVGSTVCLSGFGLHPFDTPAIVAVRGIAFTVPDVHELVLHLADHDGVISVKALATDRDFRAFTGRFKALMLHRAIDRQEVLGRHHPVVIHHDVAAVFRLGNAVLDDVVDLPLNRPGKCVRSGFPAPPIAPPCRGILADGIAVNIQASVELHLPGIVDPGKIAHQVTEGHRLISKLNVAVQIVGHHQLLDARGHRAGFYDLVAGVAVPGDHLPYRDVRILFLQIRITVEIIDVFVSRFCDVQLVSFRRIIVSFPEHILECPSGIIVFLTGRLRAPVGIGVVKQVVS